MDFIAVYLKYIECFFKSRTEYKISFILGIFSNFYSYLITYISFWVIVKYFNFVGGWNYEEMCLLYGLNLLSYSMAGMVFWPLLGLEREIANGSLDVCLTKPMGIIQQIICKNFADTFIGQFIVASIFTIMSLIKLEIRYHILKIIYLLLSLLGGFLLHGAAMIFFGTLSFWLKRSLPLADLLYLDLKNFTQYPIHIYPKIVQFILTFILPLSLVNYYPCLLILNKYKTIFDIIFSIISPIWCLLLFFLSIKFFYVGIKKYNGAGS